MEISHILETVKHFDNDTFVHLINQLEAQRQQRARDIQAQAARQIAALTGGEDSKMKKPRRTMPPKYVHPHSGQTWSGQGRKPKWFEEYLQHGGNEEDLRIK